MWRMDVVSRQINLMSEHVDIKIFSRNENKMREE